ncbi:MAG TPA: cupredoxin domain-containing protein [Dehalococcoidia bacterium]
MRTRLQGGGSRLLPLLTLLALGALVLALAAACGGDEEEEGNGGTAGGGAVTVVGTDDAGQNNRFEPDTVTIPAGESVRITFRNEGTAVHNMHVTAGDEEFSSDQIVNPGASSTFQVQVDRAGTYEFRCDFHPEMTGTLIVQ